MFYGVVVEYKVVCGFESMDVNYVYQQLSTMYWSKNIPKEIVIKSLENSLCFAVITENNQQIGFARMITDKATFAYLSDVFIDKKHQQQGVSKMLMKNILAHPDLQCLRRIMLATKDAHGLYEQFGFNTLSSPEMFMEIHQAGLYTDAVNHQICNDLS